MKTRRAGMSLGADASKVKRPSGGGGSKRKWWEKTKVVKYA